MPHPPDEPSPVGPPEGPPPPLRSAFADDAEFAPVLAPYLAGLPATRAALARCIEDLNDAPAADLAPLQRLAHQVKGSAGGYGFPAATTAAAAVLAACRANDAAAARTAAAALLAVLDRMTA